jgi:aryl-phospho-beta-D-glucosidase BglC (GH1 family)
MALIICANATAQPWRVDAQGNITNNGTIFRVKGGSWFGLEGRHEPSNDTTNPSGAPMEQYMGNVFWAVSGRTYDQDISEFKSMGINVVRLPVSPQTLTGTDPQGMAPFLKNAPAVVIANSRLALETIIKKLNTAGVYVLLDMHSCSNYVNWRKGRFDARPPWADATRDNYDFKRENCSCASSGNPAGVTKIQAYDSTKWLADLKTLAGLKTSLSVTNIMGIDIYNEPWDYTWAEWKGFIDQAYTAINAVNTDVLIFAQGIGSTAGNQDGSPTTITQTPHGVVALNPNWGENLFEAGANPPTMPKNRLVYSPHTYGPSVFVQRMFTDPAQTQCTGLEGDAIGDAKCNILINPTLLEQGWEEHFGYLKAMGYAVCIGEFGGNADWPKGKSNLRDQARYSYITDNTVDWQWQTAFVNYLVKKGITDSIYWSINPESGDTGGLYTTPYDPVSNTGGWGTWSGTDSKKLTLLQKLWGAPTTTVDPSGTATATQAPGTTTAPVGTSGDVNGSGSIDIVDALLVAQYFVGLAPANFNAAAADTNCDGSVDIVDALRIAQYFVGLLTSLSC